MQFATGFLLLTLSLLGTSAAVAALHADTMSLGGALHVMDWLAAGLAGVVFLAYGLFERLLTRLRHGGGRLLLDIVMVAVMVRGGFFVFHLILGATSPLQGRLDHPFFLAAASAWLLMFLAVFLFPGLVHRRLEQLPPLREAWDGYVRTLDFSYSRIAVVGSLLVGPAALVLPSLQFLP
ncbi:MAG: hypothetical protein WBB85_15685 [Albidovulum sp.]|uniref:hypothetical protein n=1 Tax=Albidovulum sp. TaxID=1872424 RepID=UPI003CB0E4E7